MITLIFSKLSQTCRFIEKQNLNSYLKQNIDIKKIFIILDQINDSQNIFPFPIVKIPIEMNKGADGFIQERKKFEIPAKIIFAPISKKPSNI